MSATDHEQEVAQTSGVLIKTWAKPVEILAEKEGVTGLRFAYTALDSNGAMTETGDTFSIEADMVFKAIGQYFDTEILGGLLDTKNRRIVVDENRQTSVPGIYAGGDCVPGNDLTVVAVEDGKLAAEAINDGFKD